MPVIIYYEICFLSVSFANQRGVANTGVQTALFCQESELQEGTIGWASS